MCALVYSSKAEEESSSPQEPFTVCPKCGRFIRIDGHCECEAIFFDIFINTEKR
jgi:hypothetical protein